MHHRIATADDAPLLAGLNAQLIEDEEHGNAMSIEQLVDRMRVWLSGEYAATVFERGGETVAYALYRVSSDEVHLRQFFVARDRRRSGIGRRCMQILFSEAWPGDRRITVDVLSGNGAAISFWREVGFSDYCLTLEIQPA